MDHVKIYKMEVDREIRFDRHLKNVAHQALLHVAAQRRVAVCLDAKGFMVLYRAKIRPYLESAAVT